MQKQCHLHLILLQVWLQKIPIPPSWMVYFYFEHPTPLGGVAFETPHPLRISNDHQWGGYGYFLEPHISF